jgi:hypothetical protein
MRPVALLLAGIDEAGYGPTLGPLCVGLAVFRIAEWQEGDPAPCLWRLCRAGICRKPSDSRRRVAIADSKALKLPNDVKYRHPLVHLERGVLACLSARGDGAASDDELLAQLGARLPEAPWYAGEPRALPLGQTTSQIAIAANRVAGCLHGAGVELVEVCCEVVSEGAVNRAIREHGSKAEATVSAVGAHLRRVLLREVAADECVRIVCDQLGGRTQYQEVLARELAGFEVVPLTESGERSRYRVQRSGGGKVEGVVGAEAQGLGSEGTQATLGTECRGTQAIVQFMPEAEGQHLPVALASMVAKLVRELAMMRFNRYWCGRMPELKPTAGYYGDAGRWLREIGTVLSNQEREALVRRA